MRVDPEEYNCLLLLLQERSSPRIFSLPVAILKNMWKGRVASISPLHSMGDPWRKKNFFSLKHNFTCFVFQCIMFHGEKRSVCLPFFRTVKKITCMRAKLHDIIKPGNFYLQGFPSLVFPFKNVEILYPGVCHKIEEWLRLFICE